VISILLTHRRLSYNARVDQRKLSQEQARGGLPRKPVPVKIYLKLGYHSFPIPDRESPPEP